MLLADKTKYIPPKGYCSDPWRHIFGFYFYSKWTFEGISNTLETTQGTQDEESKVTLTKCALHARRGITCTDV